MRWEYAHLVCQLTPAPARVVGLAFSHRPDWDLSENPSLGHILRLLGDDGWEIVSVTTAARSLQDAQFHALYILKKPAPAPAPSAGQRQLPALPEDPFTKLAEGLRDA